MASAKLSRSLASLVCRLGSEFASSIGRSVAGVHHTRAVCAKREFVYGGSAGVNTEGDFTERFERGKLSFTGDVLQV